MARTVKRGTMAGPGKSDSEIRIVMRQSSGPSTYLVTPILLVLLSLAMLRCTSPRRSIDYAHVPLSQSEYLKDVVEPISMVVGNSWDDGGSHGLVFRDSKQVIRSVCLLDNLAGEQDLLFGTNVPDSRGRVKHPVGGAEEKAFLGLLERWYRRDIDAKAWSKRMERSARAGHRYSILRGDETEEQI